MLQWKGDRFFALLRQQMIRNVTAACITFQNELRLVLNRPGRAGLNTAKTASARATINGQVQQITGKGRHSVKTNSVLQQRLQQQGRLEVKGGFQFYKAIGKSAHTQFANRSVFLRFGEPKKNGTRNLLSLTVRSRPGEPPRKQTGMLQRSIAYEVDRELLVGRVGTNQKTGRWLEEGTKGGKTIVAKNAKALCNPETGQFFGKRVKQGAIKPRPFFRPTLERMKPELGKILASGMPSV